MSRDKMLKCGGLVTIGAILCYFFPLAHIRPLGKHSIDASASNEQRSKVVDPVAYVDNFFASSRLRTGEGATEISQLWQAFDSDPNEAKKSGRQVGLGGATYFCVKGRGIVTSIEKNGCIVTVPGNERQAFLSLGVLVDNTVREAIGVNVNQFANSQDFNAVSSELNLRIEQNVIQPINAQLQGGAEIEFVGCAKVRTTPDLNPLLLVPIHIALLDAGDAK
ncbi:MAG: DUF2291 family protein [Planctomycetales bacterium]|nr:DUF2291 family protein [Planctomycetales bacterium]